MRIIDLYLGSLICFVLDGYELLKRLFFRPQQPSQIRSILVTKYLGMGSILLATPTLKALRSAYPECRLVLLTFENNTLFAEKLTVVDEVLSLRTSSFAAFAFDVCSLLPRLRRQRFDLVLDLEFYSRFSTIIAYLSGAAMRVGYYLAIPWRSHLVTHLVNYNPYRHITEVFASQLAPLGLTVTDFTLARPEVSSDTVTRVKTMLSSLGYRDGERLIVVNANASDLSIERRWPRENFSALITAIAALPGRKVALIGSAGEAGYVSSLFEGLPGDTLPAVMNLAGKLSIDELIVLLTCAHLCITNDSGPLHIAAALGIRTVSFFGPETPTRYGPLGENHVVYFADSYCSPCLSVYNAKRTACDGNNLCMQAIDARQVISELKEKGLL